MSFWDTIRSFAAKFSAPVVQDVELAREASQTQAPPDPIAGKLDTFVDEQEKQEGQI